MKNRVNSIKILVLALITGWLSACSNPSTPAGYMGYVTKGAWFGHDRFYEMQTGPTSTGIGWLLGVQNISITPYTYHEPMSVLSKDNLKVSFQTHIVWRVRPDQEQVKIFVEKYSTIEKDEKNPNKIVETAYNNFLKEPLRTATRNEVQALDALILKEQIVLIGDKIEKKMRSWVNTTPFNIMSVVVGDIQYPNEVANAVAKKMATTQILEQKTTEIQIAERDAQKRIKDAEGVAKAMEIINQRLTAQYLQHEAIEAQKAMVGSPNHTTIYIPVGPNGVPLAGTFNPATGR